MGDGIAHLDLARGLDAGYDIAYIAGGKLLTGLHVEFEHSDFIGIIFLAGGHEFHEVVFADCAVDNLEICDDAAEGIENRVENQRLERLRGVSLGSGDTLDDGTEDFGYTDAGLAARADDFLRVAAEKIHNLILHLVGLGAVEVDLVDYGDNLKVVVDSHVEVGDGLSLYAL